MSACQHPADQGGPTLLLTCPDCGAECSGDQIGEDNLCYDERCPLHVMEGRTVVLPPIRVSPRELAARRAAAAAAGLSLSEWVRRETNPRG